MVLVRQTEVHDLRKGVAVGIRTVEGLVAELVINARVLQNSLSQKQGQFFDPLLDPVHDLLLDPLLQVC